MIAALYVDPNGVYAGLDGVEVWGEARDARRYYGPWPVVAHPPCQRWCMFAKGIETKFGYRVGDDSGCFEAALNAVHRFGGVIEHPAGSLAWDHFWLPKPASPEGWTMTLHDDDGASCYVEQGRYGQPMRKATWLYAYGVELPALRWGRRIDSEAGAFKRRLKLYKPESNWNRPRVDSQHSDTPVEFRDVLLEMARTAGVAACA